MNADTSSSSLLADFKSRYQRGDFDDFFELAPGQFEAALKTPRSCDRARLSAALRRYAQTLAAPPAVFEMLARLEHPQSRAVVTGQQAGLLLGPTFSLSKAVTAINLAKRLSTDDKPVVPIFWVASQDGDSAEIDHTRLLDLSETLHKLELPLPADVPSGRIPLASKWPLELCQKLKTFDYQTAHLDEIISLLQETADRSSSVADWFAALLYALLGEQGLIVLNPLEPDIAPLFADVLTKELAEPLPSSRAINEAAQRLRELGETPQLGRGEDATNLFVTESDGKRRLLRFGGQDFYSDTRRYQRNELLSLLAQDASRLTPAAGLRPITQDAALPTALTVVGPGELRYFAQLRGVYKQHGVAMPLIQPRMTVTVLEPPVARILDKYDLTARELVKDIDAVRDAKLLAQHGYADTFETGLEGLDASVRTMLEAVRELDPTLLRTVTRSESRLEETLERLRFKTARALLKQDDITRRQFARLEAHLLPNGAPQGRVLSPFSFFLKFGMQPVLDEFLALPPEGDHVISL